MREGNERVAYNKPIDISNAKLVSSARLHLGYLLKSFNSSKTREKKIQL